MKTSLTLPILIPVLICIPYLVSLPSQATFSFRYPLCHSLNHLHNDMYIVGKRRSRAIRRYHSRDYMRIGSHAMAVSLKGCQTLQPFCPSLYLSLMRLLLTSWVQKHRQVLVGILYPRLIGTLRERHQRWNLSHPRY